MKIAWTHLREKFYPSLLAFQKNLAALDAAEGYTETAFDVDNFTEELRILALGKLSQAILEIPIGEYKRSGEGGVVRFYANKNACRSNRCGSRTGARKDTQYRINSYSE